MRPWSETSVRAARIPHSRISAGKALMGESIHRSELSAVNGKDQWTGQQIGAHHFAGRVKRLMPQPRRTGLECQANAGHDATS